MQQIIKCIKLMAVALVLGICFLSISANAQSPADDPGIGGPGSPGNGPSGDGGPIVPLDRDLSALLIAVGIIYGYKKVKQQQLLVG